MKILIYGAGVLGSLAAARLQDAGQDVTLLARGQRLADLRQHGVVLEDLVTGQQTVTQVNLIEHLEPDDAYDLVAVNIGKHQVPSVLPALAANHFTPNVLFLGNNVAGPAGLVAVVGRARVLQGFLAAGGTRSGHVVRCLFEMDGRRARLILGELDGQTTLRLVQTMAAFESAGFLVEISPNIDAWLKSHAALILPLGGAYFLAGDDTKRLARTPDGVILLVRAMREALRVLQAHGFPILPAQFKLLQWLPEPLLAAWLKRILMGDAIQYGLVHAHAARPEMQQLVVEFKELAWKVGQLTPALDRLSAAIDPQAPPLPVGSAEMRLDWRPLRAILGALVVLGLGAAWLQSRRR